MVIVVYAAQTGKSISANLGRPEYSYYFVLKAFGAVLRKLAYVVETSDPKNDVDAIYEKCRSMGEPCVFFSFSPPHKTVTGLKCPAISVFAWEFATMPADAFAGDRRNDWRSVLAEHGYAITHSSFSVGAIRRAMGSDFPVWSIPAPVWDDYVPLHRDHRTSARSKGVDLTFEGGVIDFDGCDVPWVPEEERKGFIEQRSSPKNNEPPKVNLNGIVYTTVFSATDGRKNWRDLVSSFVWAFRDSRDATLVLKVMYRHLEDARGIVTDELFKLTPFRCRIIILQGYLDDAEYAKLVRCSTYVVNASHGEGQCLPLMESMSAGKPAVSPAHTAMGDYINPDNAFVVRSSAEKAFWPQDPREALRTTRYRINWESLYKAYLESYQVAKGDPARYARMSRTAVASLQAYCSRALAEERLKAVLRQRVGADEAPSSSRGRAWRTVVIPIWKMWNFVLAPRLQAVRLAGKPKQ